MTNVNAVMPTPASPLRVASAVIFTPVSPFDLAAVAPLSDIFGEAGGGGPGGDGGDGPTTGQLWPR